MVGRLPLSIALALLLVMPRPTLADDTGLTPSTAPPTAPPPQPSPAGWGTGVVLMVVGGLLCAASVYLLRDSAEKDPDGAPTRIWYGMVGFAVGIPLVVGGISLVLPFDPTPGAPSHPSLAQAPRGLALRFAF